MFELLTFIYSNASLTAALTIGAWVGAPIGAVAGGVLVYKYLRWNHPRGDTPLNLLVRFASYTALSALFIVVPALGVLLGGVVGAYGLFVAWVVLLPSLVGGCIGLIVYFVRRRMKSVKTIRVDADAALADRV